MIVPHAGGIEGCGAATVVIAVTLSTTCTAARCTIECDASRRVPRSRLPEATHLHGFAVEEAECA